MDRISEQHRSWNMSRIKSKNTRPELVVRTLLHALGYRFRLHSDKLPGRPDIVLPKYNTVIFVHGCFWHRHKGCKYAYEPKTRKEYWAEKFEKNIYRDKLNHQKLVEMGWKVITIWECETYNMNSIRTMIDFHLKS
jgi:DNA mismatch endonuclease (patch repair protein)